MIPIFSNNGQAFNYTTFKDYLLQECGTHKDEQRALAFAFIVYDFKDHTISKILKDETYWAALDDIAGPYLSVFYIHSQNEHYQMRQRQIHLEEQKRSTNDNHKRTISYFTPIQKEVTPLDKSIALIKKDFDITENINQPFVLFFQTSGEEILDYFLVSLKQEKVENAFLELKSHIKNAVKGIQQVTSENFDNHQEIFDLLKSEVESGKFYNFFQKKVVPKVTIGSIIAFIKIIAGAVS